MIPKNLLIPKFPQYKNIISIKFSPISMIKEKNKHLFLENIKTVKVPIHITMAIEFNISNNRSPCVTKINIEKTEIASILKIINHSSK